LPTTYGSTEPGPNGARAVALPSIRQRSHRETARAREQIQPLDEIEPVWELQLRQDREASRKVTTRRMTDQVTPVPYKDGNVVSVQLNKNYGNGASAWQAASLAIAAPLGSTRMVASSTAQKLRTPVWLNVTGTPAA
jgi:hypothetical protein